MKHKITIILLVIITILSIGKYYTEVQLNYIPKLSMDSFSFNFYAYHLYNKAGYYEVSSFGEKRCYRSPGLPYAIYLVYTIFGYNFDYIYWFNAILYSTNVLLIFGILTELLNKKAGLFAALIMLLFLPLNAFVTTLYSEVLFVWMTLVTIYLSVRTMNRKTSIYYVLISYVILIYIKPIAVIYLTLFLVVYFYDSYPLNKKSIKPATITLLKIIVFVFLFFLPWIIRNYYHFNTKVLFNTNKWAPQITNVNPDGYNRYHFQNLSRFYYENKELGEAKINDAGNEFFWRKVFANPKKWFFHGIGNYGYLWRIRKPFRKNFFFVPVRIFNFTIYGISLEFILFFSVILFLPIVLFRKFNYWHFFFIAIIVSISALYSFMFWTTERFRYPLYPLLIILFSHFVGLLLFSKKEKYKDGIFKPEYIVIGIIIFFVLGFINYLFLPVPKEYKSYQETATKLYEKYSHVEEFNLNDYLETQFDNWYINMKAFTDAGGWVYSHDFPQEPVPQFANQNVKMLGAAFTFSNECEIEKINFVQNYFELDDNIQRVRMTFNIPLQDNIYRDGQPVILNAKTDEQGFFIETEIKKMSFR